MPANVETMFYVREKPWHGLGVEVQEAPTSADALIYAGLDWEVIQKNVYSEYVSGSSLNFAGSSFPSMLCAAVSRTERASRIALRIFFLDK